MNPIKHQKFDFQTKNKTQKIKQSSILKTMALLGLLNFTTNFDAIAQRFPMQHYENSQQKQNQSNQNKNKPEVSFEFILGLNKGVRNANLNEFNNLTYDKSTNNGLTNSGENLYLDIGLMQIRNDLGLGFIYTTPLNKTHLGKEITTSKTNLDRGLNPYVVTKEVTNDVYLQKNTLEGLISFEKEKHSLFFTVGIQQNKLTDVLNTKTHAEYENNNYLNRTQTLAFPETKLENIKTNAIAGLGVKFKHKKFGGYIRATTTFNKPKNEQYIGAGLTYKFLTNKTFKK